MNEVVKALMDASSEEEVKAVIKKHNRADFVEAAEELGIVVENSDQKADIASLIVEDQSENVSSSKDDAIAPSQPVQEKAKAQDLHPVVRINDRVEAIELDPKLGCIVIIDGKYPVHVPESRISKVSTGTHIGRY